MTLALCENGWFNAHIEYLLNTKDIRLSRSIKLYTPIEHPVISQKICLTVSNHSFANKYFKKVDNRYFDFLCFWTSQPQIVLNLFLFLLPISVLFFLQSFLLKTWIHCFSLSSESAVFKVDLVIKKLTITTTLTNRFWKFSVALRHFKRASFWRRWTCGCKSYRVFRTYETELHLGGRVTLIQI